MLKILTALAIMLTFISVSAEPLILANDGNYRIAPYIYYSQEQGQPIGIAQILSPTINWTKNTQDDVNLGFSNHAYWLKFEVENHNILNHEWALELAYPILDNVDMYAVNSHRQVISYFYGGDKYLIEEKFVRHPNIVFPIDLFPHESIMIYIRVESEGSIQIPLVLWEWDDFNFHTLIHFLFQGLFYGMVLIMAIYNLMVWLSEKERVYVSYVSYILFFALFQLSLHGIGYQFLWPSFPSINKYITPISMSLVCFSLFYFIDDFFHIKNFNIYFYRTIKISAYLSLCLAFLTFVLPYYLTIYMSTLFVLYAVMLVIFIALYMLNLNHPSARFFVIAWAVFLVGALFLLGNKLGLIPITVFSEYGVQLGAGLEIMFLSLALADRMANTQKDKIKAQQQSLELAHQVNQEKERSFNAEIENLRIEREHRQKLESLVTLRTQELQHTLDELSTVNEKLKTISITDALTGLNNRYYFNENWKKEYKRAHRDQKFVSIIILDIDFFKKVNDKHGHPAGDMCLKHVAHSILKHAAREMDIVCRYGGEEFAIILPSTEERGAMEVAEKIRKDIEHLHLTWDGEKFNITASLGICCSRPDNRDEKSQQSMINHADQALYQAKAQGRNQVVIFNNV
ncbi:MAG: diguanylate cyclase (GGDEF)-like protein [Oceanicoccus sp.]|jgi:diguanylate cyclase (GGDEF)-like protein